LHNIAVYGVILSVLQTTLLVVGVSEVQCIATTEFVLILPRVHTTTVTDTDTISPSLCLQRNVDGIGITDLPACGSRGGL